MSLAQQPAADRDQQQQPIAGCTGVESSCSFKLVGGENRGDFENPSVLADTSFLTLIERTESEMFCKEAQEITIKPIKSSRHAALV